MSQANSIHTSYYLTASDIHRYRNGGFISLHPDMIERESWEKQPEIREAVSCTFMPHRFKSRAEEVEWLNREAQIGRPKKEHAEDEYVEPITIGHGMRLLNDADVKKKHMEEIEYLKKIIANDVELSRLADILDIKYLFI